MPVAEIVEGDVADVRCCLTVPERRANSICQCLGRALGVFQLGSCVCCAGPDHGHLGLGYRGRRYGAFGRLAV